MGRYKKAPTERKVKQVAVRLREATFYDVKAAAARVGVSVSYYIRQIVERETTDGNR